MKLRVSILLLFTLALPQLAQADPLNNGALGLIAYFVLGLLVLAVALAGLSAWTYRQPGARGPYWVQFVPLGLSVLLGSWLHFSLDGHGLPLLGSFNPLLDLCLPLAAWLNAVSLARDSESPARQRLWAGLAAVALQQGLLQVGQQLFLRFYGPPGFGDDAGRQLTLLALGLGSSVLAWVVVLRQLLQPALWQPLWQTPAVGAAFAGGVFLLRLFFFLAQHDSAFGPPPLAIIFWNMLRLAMLTWIAGVGALLLTRRVDYQ